MHNVNNHIKSLNFGYRVKLMDANVEYLNARASFVDPHTIQYTKSNGDTVIQDTIIIIIKSII